MQRWIQIYRWGGREGGSWRERLAIDLPNRRPRPHLVVVIRFAFLLRAMPGIMTVFLPVWYDNNKFKKRGRGFYDYFFFFFYTVSLLPRICGAYAGNDFFLVFFSLF